MRCSTWNGGGSGQPRPNQTSFHVERLDALSSLVYPNRQEPMRRESCVHRRLLRQERRAVSAAVSVCARSRGEGSLCLPHLRPKTEATGNATVADPRASAQAASSEDRPGAVSKDSERRSRTGFPAFRTGGWRAPTTRPVARPAMPLYRRFKPMNSLIFLMRVGVGKRPAARYNARSNFRRASWTTKTSTIPAKSRS